MYWAPAPTGLSQNGWLLLVGMQWLLLPHLAAGLTGLHGPPELADELDELALLDDELALLDDELALLDDELDDALELLLLFGVQLLMLQL